MQISSHWKHMYNKEKQTHYSYMGYNVTKCIYCLLFGGLWWSMIKIGPSCFQAIFSHISAYLSNNETSWQELLKFKSRILLFFTFFLFLRVMGPLHRIQGYQNFKRGWPLHSRHQHQLFIYGIQCDKKNALQLQNGCQRPFELSDFGQNLSSGHIMHV